MSGYTGWSDDKLSREQDRIEKMEIQPGSPKAAERTRVLGNIRREFDARAKVKGTFVRRVTVAGAFTGRIL